MSGELTRRQELLRRAGNFASVRDYDRARAAGAPTCRRCPRCCWSATSSPRCSSPSPTSSTCSSRLDGSAARSACTCCSPRSGWRRAGCAGWRPTCPTGSPCAPSRPWSPGCALGGADAAELPASPGHGYLAVGTDALQRFKAAYVSGPHRAARWSRRGAVRTADPRRTAPLPWQRTGPPSGGGAGRARPARRHRGDRLAGQGTPAHQVWLPPLREPPHLDDAARRRSSPTRPRASPRPTRLRGALTGAGRHGGQAVEQRRDVAWLDLAGAAGHVAVVGSPQSGKSTARAHAGHRARADPYAAGGAGLLPRLRRRRAQRLRDLPHVGGVAGRLDQADGTAHGRRGRHPARRPGAVNPRAPDSHVFLVVDGWSTLRTDFEDLEPVLVDIATRGLSYGVHLVITATRWFDFRQNVADLFGSTVELRLGDPGRLRRQPPPRDERARGRARPRAERGRAAPAHRAAARRRRGTEPGHRGRLVRSGGTAGTDAADPAALRSPARRRARRSAKAWRCPSASPRPTCDRSGSTSPPSHTCSSSATSVASHPCCAAWPSRSRVGSRPEQARIVLIDYRRSLLGAVTTDHLIGYGIEAEHATALIASAASYMDERRPGPQVTAEQLRTRSWWDGPELFVLVDDYDMVAAGGRNPLTPLLDHLGQARDVGLHLVVARRAGGASRALFDPVIARPTRARLTRPRAVGRQGRGGARRQHPPVAPAAGPGLPGPPFRGPTHPTRPPRTHLSALRRPAPRSR